MEPLFVISDTHRHAEDWARMMKIPLAGWTFISTQRWDLDKLRGMVSPIVVVTRARLSDEQEAFLHAYQARVIVEWYD